MASHSVLSTEQGLYEDDFIEWTERMSALLRSRSTVGLDWDNLAEEIQDLGRSQKSAIKSRLEIVLLHLIKWEIQPRRRSASWESSISGARLELDALQDSVPSLRRYLKEEFEHCYDRAFHRALKETRLPETAAYTRWPREKVLDAGFLPE